MPQLNLLPNEIKREISRKINYIRFANFSILLLISIFASSLFFWGSHYYFQLKLADLETPQARDSSEEETERINDLLRRVSLVQKEYIKWSRVLVNFFDLCPDGIQLRGLVLDKNNNRLKLEAHARERADFLRFKSNLEQSDMITDLNSPITNLLKPADFFFTLEAGLNF